MTEVGRLFIEDIEWRENQLRQERERQRQSDLETYRYLVRRGENKIREASDLLNNSKRCLTPVQFKAYIDEIEHLEKIVDSNPWRTESDVEDLKIRIGWDVSGYLEAWRRKGYFRYPY